MTRRQLALINKINNYVNDEEDDLYLDFDDYRELNDLLKTLFKVRDIAEELYDIAGALCDRMTDFPAGCDACSLCDEDDGSCYFREVRAKYKELIG